MFDTYQMILTVAADGAALGLTPHLNGKLYAVYLDFGNSIGVGTDTTISSISPAATLLTITDSQTDAWYLPRRQVHTPAGVAMTYDGTRVVAEPYPIAGQIQIAVAGGVEAGTLTATVFIETP